MKAIILYKNDLETVFLDRCLILTLVHGYCSILGIHILFHPAVSEYFDMTVQHTLLALVS